MVRLRIRPVFLSVAAGLLLSTVSVLAQGIAPVVQGSGRQDSVADPITPDAVRKLAMRLQGMNADKLDPELLKLVQDFLKKNPNFKLDQKHYDAAKKFIDTQPQLKDPKKQEQFLKNVGIDPKNPPKIGGGPDIDFPGADSNNPPTKLTPPTQPPASTQLPKGQDPPKSTPPTEPPQVNGPGDPVIPPSGNPTNPPPQTGQPWNPNQLAENQKQFQQFAGWWEQNIGPLNETPAVKQLIQELFTNSSDGGAGSFSDLFNGANPNDIPSLGSGGGWKLPDLGFGSGATSTDVGFTPPSGPDTGAFGGFGGGFSGPEGSWLPVILLAVFAGAGLLAWWLWPKLMGKYAGEPRPLPGLGPWPIDPRNITDREGLVKAFEYLSVLVCGAGAKVWNHVTIAGALERATPHAEALADPLARLYAVARYTPANEPLPPGAITEARGYLCELAGVRGA